MPTLHEFQPWKTSPAWCSICGAHRTDFTRHPATASSEHSSKVDAIDKLYAVADDPATSRENSEMLLSLIGRGFWGPVKFKQEPTGRKFRSEF